MDLLQAAQNWPSLGLPPAIRSLGMAGFWSPWPACKPHKHYRLLEFVGGDATIPWGLLLARPLPWHRRSSLASPAACNLDSGYRTIHIAVGSGLARGFGSCLPVSLRMGPPSPLPHSGSRCSNPFPPAGIWGITSSGVWAYRGISASPCTS